VKVLDIFKFREALAFGANEYKGVWKKTDPAGLIENEPPLINKRLVLVIQKDAVDTLLR
jgi:hypothetical protein